MTTEPTPQEQVQFLTDIQRLVADGQFVATYKFALLMALADLAVEGKVGADDTLSTRLIAEKFIQYYWRQVVPFPGKGLLRQNTGRQAEVVRRLEEIRRASGASLAELRAEERRWKRLVSAVERTVVKMPLWKLQTVGRERMEFLYASHTDPHYIALKPGVSQCLRKFHSLVTDIVRGAWVRYIRRVNEGVFGAGTDLHAFLFGAERADLGQVAPALQELQEGRCFYCQSVLRRDGTHIDHFIPWSRYPVDLAHNFVLAPATRARGIASRRWIICNAGSDATASTATGSIRRFVRRTSFATCPRPNRWRAGRTPKSLNRVARPGAEARNWCRWGWGGWSCWVGRDGVWVVFR